MSQNDSESVCRFSHAPWSNCSAQLLLSFNVTTNGTYSATIVMYGPITEIENPPGLVKAIYYHLEDKGIVSKKICFEIRDNIRPDVICPHNRQITISNTTKCLYHSRPAQLEANELRATTDPVPPRRQEKLRRQRNTKAPAAYLRPAQIDRSSRRPE